MDLLDIALVIGTGIKWLVYTGLLWIMIKIQKLNYNVLGLFGSSLAATLTTFIPVVGPYLAYVVLVICLWKCTGADIAPDVVFTVGIAGALMFCFNLWLLGMLMGNLNPSFGAKEGKGADTEMADEMPGDEEEAADKASTPAAPTAPKTVRVNARTPAVAPARPGQPQAPVADAGPFTLKGVSLNSSRPSVMIYDGSQIHSVSPGDSITVQLPQGRTRLRCEEITKAQVTLKGSNGQTFQLRVP